MSEYYISVVIVLFPYNSGPLRMAVNRTIVGQM